MPIYKVSAKYDDDGEVEEFLVAALENDTDSIVEAVNQLATRPATVKGWREWDPTQEEGAK